MATHKRGRHAPAFILLSIAMEPNHGLGILNKMNELVTNNRLDTAVIYRSLKELEKEGYITSNWEDSGSGPKRKVYQITAEGKIRLEEYKDDIEKSLMNLQSFLNLYNEID